MRAPHSVKTGAIEFCYVHVTRRRAQLQPERLTKSQNQALPPHAVTLPVQHSLEDAFCRSLLLVALPPHVPAAFL